MEIKGPCSPISSLPDELLGSIFELFRTEPIRGKDEGHKAWWTSIMLVCRLWRDVLLNTPLLWTGILFHRIDLVELMLQRSKTAPISIYHDFSLNYMRSAGHEEAVRDVLEHHIHHAREVDLSAPTLTFFDITKILRKPAPELTDLRLICVGGFGSGYKECSITRDLLAESAPRLRSISLRGICIPLDSALISPKLCHLSLNDILRQQSFPAEQLVHLLRDLPLLETLRIQYSHEGAHSFTEKQIEAYPLPEEPIVLSKLSTLTFCATAKYTVTVMRNIVISPGAETTFWILPSKIITSFLPHYIGLDPAITPWNSLYIFSNNVGLQVSAYVENDETGGVQAAAQSSVYREDQAPFSLFAPARSDMQYRILSQILTSIPLGSIRNLMIEIPDTKQFDMPFELADWNSLFAPFKSVVSLRIWDCNRNDDISLSIEPGLRDRMMEAVENYDSAEPRFTTLKHLHLRLGGLRGESARSRRPSLWEAGWYNDLVDYRAQAGVPLDTYTIEGYPVHEEELEEWFHG